MPPSRLLAPLAVILAPTLAAADTGRFGANAGVDTGHGDGSAIHQGVFVRLSFTPRLAGELELEQITPRDDDRGDAVTGFGGAVIYQIGRRRSVTPFARVGAGLEGSPGACAPGHQRADLGVGAEVVIDHRFYIGADVRFTRRWEDDPGCVYDDAQPGSLSRREPGDPWDDLALRLSLGVGF